MSINEQILTTFFLDDILKRPCIPKVTKIPHSLFGDTSSESAMGVLMQASI